VSKVEKKEVISHQKTQKGGGRRGKRARHCDQKPKNRGATLKGEVTRSRPNKTAGEVEPYKSMGNWMREGLPCNQYNTERRGKRPIGNGQDRRCAARRQTQGWCHAGEEGRVGVGMGT